MEDSTSGTGISISRLIFVPAVITLAVTILRLVGELQHWSQLFFNPSAGGGLAIVGVSWLPFIFGPYFALRIAGNGEWPKSVGKAIGLTAVGIALFVAGGFVGFGPALKFPGKELFGLVLMAGGGAVVLPGWPALFKTLLAYAYAARIPVAIVMYFAIQGSWGTHYDAVPPEYKGAAEFWPKYIELGLLPQLVLWIAYTILVGALFGSIAAAVVRRKAAPQTAS